MKSRIFVIKNNIAMITIQRITDTDSAEYRFMEGLMIQAFPREEYREPEELRAFTEKNRMFYNNLVCDEGRPVGLFTYWDFGTFHYVEHFAIAPEMRNRGYGKLVLDAVKAMIKTPLVLEVELPEDDIARRRIGFYERCGFILWESEYRQPPYRKGDDFLPLRLMVCGRLDEAASFDTVRRKIYENVYGCDE